MYKVKVFITLKQSVLDPQGQAVRSSLHQLGEESVHDVRIGKYIELSIDEKNADLALKSAKRVVEKLLVNAVTETYSLQLEESDWTLDFNANKNIIKKFY